MRRVGPAIDNDAWEFAKGKPCGNSWISMDKNCLKGGEGGSAPPKESLDGFWRGQASRGEIGYNSRVEGFGSHLVGMKNVPPEWITTVEKKKETYNKLSPDEKSAVQMYGNDGLGTKIYRELNAKLRTGEDPSPDKAAAVDYVEAHLKSGLKKLPDTEGDFYRAVSGGGVTALANVQPGDVIRDNGFGSYSDRGGPKIASFIREGEENAVMIVKGKTFKNVSPVMPFQEGEHLSQPGTQLRLTRIETKGYYDRSAGNIPAYYFEEV
jgi:hypothetical protein